MCPPVQRADTQVGPYTGPKSKIRMRAGKVVR